MRTSIVGLAIILTLGLGAVTGLVRVDAAEPCCNITALDATNQTATARETKTGRTFQFKVADTKSLSALKVGQAVHADFKTMKVSLSPDGIAPCCNLVNLRAPATTPVR